MNEDEISYKVIGAVIEGHKTVGGPDQRLTGKKLGLLINIGRKSVKEGISRIVNG